MRTTVRLDDALLDEVKQVALERRLTLTAVLEAALREMLARRKQLALRPRVALPTFKGSGVQPGVDLDSNAALEDLMDAGDGPR